MCVDSIDGKSRSYDDWVILTQNRNWEEWNRLNKARNIQSDITNLCGIKEGEEPFKDDWFHKFPARRRRKGMYPSEIPTNVGL